MCGDVSPTGLSTPDTSGKSGLGGESREDLYRGQAESGMSNIRLNFTFNISPFPLPLPAHVCNEWRLAQTYLISDFNINTWCEQGHVVTYVLPTDSPAQLHSHPLTPISDGRRSVRTLRSSWCHQRAKSARGNVIFDMFSKCHGHHDSWLGHFHTIFKLK